MGCQRSRANAGFTLIEVLVTVCVLGIGLAALYSGIGYGFKCIGLAREERRATQILLEATETLRLYDWDQLHDPNFLPSAVTYAYDPSSTGNHGITYTNRINVTPVLPAVENYLNNLSQVTVALDWSNGSAPHHREITTFITRRGLQGYVY
jgi:prepilin-type N-terminal cleavage/methylation domain-containing protein